MTALITDHVWLSTLCTKLSQTLGCEVSFHAACDAGETVVPSSHVVWQRPVHAGGELAGHLRVQTAASAAGTTANQVVETATLFAEVLERLVSVESLLQERDLQARSLDELGRMDDSPPALPDVVRRCLRVALQTCQAWGAAFFLTDSTQQHLQLRMAETLTPARIPHARRQRATTPDGLALSQGETLLSATNEADREWLPEGCRIAAVTPVQASAGSLGTLWIYERRLRTWSTRELQSLRMVAGQLAAGLERLVLLQEREARQKQLTYASTHHRVSALSPALAEAGLDVAVRSRSPDPLGGDLCEVWPIDERYTLLAIGDATGHSVPAAMTMSVVRGSLRTLLGASPQEVIAVERLAGKINRALHSVTHGEQFMTMICAVYDAQTRLLTFANGGHPCPWLIRGAQLLELKSHGLMLGVLPDATHDRFQTRLQPGDQLLLITDGVLEAMSREREMFGTTGLAKSLMGTSRGDADATATAIWTALDRHVAGQAPRDDQTLLVLRVVEPSPR